MDSYTKLSEEAQALSPVVQSLLTESWLPVAAFAMELQFSFYVKASAPIQWYGTTLPALLFELEGNRDIALRQHRGSLYFKRLRGHVVHAGTQHQLLVELDRITECPLNGEGFVQLGHVLIDGGLDWENRYQLHNLVQGLLNMNLMRVESKQIYATEKTKKLLAC